jgi:tRNA U34 5-methylaminomethyl-2-thiouridine-forming methyltransferase MnmC
MDDLIDYNESAQITKTRDGSTTIYSERFDQHYHNPNGAVKESRYVFFDTAGVPRMLEEQDEITVLETGFGTGLNLVLMLDYLKRTGSGCRVNYISIEAFPISANLVKDLDFGSELSGRETGRLLNRIFSALQPGWNRFEITHQCTLHLYIGIFEDLTDLPIQGKVNLLFHDPFSPDANPELWTLRVFRKLKSMAAGNATLVTYCAASSARAAMAAAGWCVARAPGALGKREMTIASPDVRQLGKFKRVNEERLKMRYEAGDFKR